MDYERLGGYQHFSGLTGHPVPLANGSITFAGGVVEDLVAGIAKFLDEFRTRFPSHGREIRQPVLIGCVPWLTFPPLVETLKRFNHSVLLLVDKSGAQAEPVKELARLDIGLAQYLLHQLRTMAPADADGNPPVIGPYSSMPAGDRVLGPVRLIGWRKKKNSRRSVPILHAKLLWLGYSELLEGMGEFGEDVEGLFPVAAWMGSANWTSASLSSLETGMWSTEPLFCDAVLKYLIALVTFSEPFSSETVRPTPELVEAIEDEAAFYEAMMETMWRDPPEDEDD